MLHGLYGVNNNGKTLYNEYGKRLFNTRFAGLLQRIQHKIFWTKHKLMGRK